MNIVASTGATSFNPNPVSANAGDSVAFKNSSSDLHHIVLDDGTADLGEVSPGQTSKMLTVKAGGAKFHCEIHSSMVGAINGPIPDPPPCVTPGYCD